MFDNDWAEYIQYPNHQGYEGSKYYDGEEGDDGSWDGQQPDDEPVDEEEYVPPPPMAMPTHGQRQQRTMSITVVGIPPLALTQMEPFTLPTQIWIVMIFGSAVMMVQHGRI